jgi:uncharacterized protein (TIGR03000 family)
LGWGWPWYGGGWGGGYGGGYYSPSYSSYDYSDSYPYDYNDYGYQAPSYDTYGYRGEPPQPSPEDMNAAHIRVLADPNAQITFDGVPTSQTGEVRYFTTPELQPGREYHYDIRANVAGGNRPMGKSRTVSIHAGDAVTVDMR